MSRVRRPGPNIVISRNPMILNLPFAYQAEIIPTRRHRRPRPRSLRGYTLAQVPELAAHDVSEAIHFQEATADKDAAATWTTIVSYGGRLFRPATIDGAPLTGTDLEEAVSQDRKYQAWPEEDAAIARQLPHPGVRVAWSMSEALLCHVYGRQMAIDRFRDPQVVRSDEDLQRAEAQHYFSQAIVLVDGVLHVETSEPVWRVVTKEGNSSVELEVAPTLMSADRLFRLDQLERATAFARSSGELSAEAAGLSRVTIADPQSLARIDVHALAKVALAFQDSLLSLSCQLAGETPYKWRNYAENYRFLSDVHDPCGDIAVGILDKMERVWRRIEAEFECGGMSTYDGRGIAAIVKRWSFDKEYGLPAGPDDLAEEDVAALADLAETLSFDAPPSPVRSGSSS